MTLLGKWKRGHRRRRRTRRAKMHPTPLTVRDLAPGQTARVIGFSPQLSSDRRALLRAYGLVIGYPIRVLQHSPVCVVQIEHTEIALEQELADDIYVCLDTLV